MLYSGAVGVSLYGNDDLHNGVVQFQTSARALDDLVISVKNQVRLKCLIHIYLYYCNNFYLYLKNLFSRH